MIGRKTPALDSAMDQGAKSACGRDAGMLRPLAANICLKEALP